MVVGRVSRVMSAVVLVLMLSACVSAPGCEEKPKAPAGFMAVTIGGRPFTLEIAADDAKRTKGLGGRTEIAPDGGMLFSFRASAIRHFIMRDCPVDIDIIFLDAACNVTRTHAMKAEPPRGEGEGEPGDFVNPKYHSRLKQYSSRYSAKYAIELRGGTLEGLGVQEGDHIELDTKALARVTE